MFNIPQWGGHRVQSVKSVKEAFFNFLGIRFENCFKELLFLTQINSEYANKVFKALIQ